MAKRNQPAKGEELLAFARELADAGCNWLQVNNALYGPGGKFAEIFPTTRERALFSGSVLDKQLQRVLEALPEPVDRSGDRQASGKLLLRMPKSVHQALISEAEAEGVSLNQLILSKLAMQLRVAAAS